MHTLAFSSTLALWHLTECSRAESKLSWFSLISLPRPNITPFSSEIMLVMLSHDIEPGGMNELQVYRCPALVRSEGEVATQALAQAGGAWG